MSTSLTNKNKNTLNVSNETKPGTDQEWRAEDGDGEWGEQGKSTWAFPRTVVSLEDKNNVSVTNESKN